tara:strand:+ start:260 stop:886 length:627 start_codon:yes stop_codon:yes gene_type:complete
MRSYGPKPLIRLDANQNIIQRQIKIIQNNFTNYEIVLVTGFESDKLMKNTPDFLIKVENENYEKNNVVRSIGMALRAATTDKIVIIYGDLVFNEEAISNFKFEQSCIMIDESETMGEEEVGCNICDGSIEQMLPDMPNKWGQISYFIDKELSLLKKISWDKNKSHYFGFEAINEIIDRGGDFKAVSPEGAKITDVDSSKDLIAARKII